MILQRTANAGVLLEMDGVSILLDGVCRQEGPYLETPEPILQKLRDNPPDAVAFTHAHADHYRKDYAEAFHRQTLRPVLGPESLQLDGLCTGAYTAGDVQIRPVPSRHIGKVREEHRSYILTGSRCVWFMGDASPLQWQNTALQPKPDILIAPFAYAANETGWEIVKQLHPKIFVLVHMPDRNNDIYGLWEKVYTITIREKWLFTVIPEMGQRLIPRWKD